MDININWSQLGVGSLVAFLLGWLLVGLFAAVVLAVVVCLLMGIIKIR